jgi:hypothetical protein
MVGFNGLPADIVAVTGAALTVLFLVGPPKVRDRILELIGAIRGRDRDQS